MPTVALDKLSDLEQGVRVDIGRAVRTLRERHRANQGVLAGALGVDQRTISRIESGGQRVYVDQLLAIEAALGERPGMVLALAGVTSIEHGVEEAIAADPALDPAGRKAMLALYREMAAAR